MSLLRSLGYSLLAHGVLLTLWWQPVQRDPVRGGPSAMQAMLSSAGPVRAAATTAPVPAPVLARPLPNAPESSLAKPLPSASSPAVERAVATSAGGASFSVPHGQVAGEFSRYAESAPVPEPRAVISAEGLRQYQYALARETKRHYQYPALARERGWEGRVEVRIGVVPGQRPVVGLLRSSGHDMLDEQALAMVGKALPAVALPDTLRGHSFSVPVPVEFSLRDD